MKTQDYSKHEKVPITPCYSFYSTLAQYTQRCRCMCTSTTFFSGPNVWQSCLLQLLWTRSKLKHFF